MHHYDNYNDLTWNNGICWLPLHPPCANPQFAPRIKPGERDFFRSMTGKALVKIIMDSWVRELSKEEPGVTLDFGQGERFQTRIVSTAL